MIPSLAGKLSETDGRFDADAGRDSTKTTDLVSI
jgi:hypothetical protein